MKKSGLILFLAAIFIASVLHAAPVVTWHFENIANPFSPEKGPILIRYTIDSSSTAPLRTSIKIYNMAGKLIRTILNSGLKSVGTIQTDSWDGKDDRGRMSLNGRYFLTLDVEDISGKKQSIYTIALVK
jgi:hypothetical protein